MNFLISHIRKALTSLTLTVLLATGALITRANGHDPIGSPKGSASTAEVKYIGGSQGEPIINVVYSNTAGSRFSLRVLDADGNQIFQSFYSDKNFDKKFKILDVDNKLTFVIKNYQDNSTQSFEVNSNTHLEEKIEVTEVK